MFRQNIFHLVLSAFLLLSCSSTGPDETFRSTDINFSFVDKNGNDLLRSSHSDKITEQNTDLYFLKNGKKQRAFDDNLDHPKHFFISDEKISNRYFMRVFPNIIDGQETATTYIEFSDASKDTIKVQYKDEPTVVTKIWYNGELRWDTNSDNNNEENNNDNHEKTTIRTRSIYFFILYISLRTVA